MRSYHSPAKVASAKAFCDLPVDKAARGCESRLRYQALSTPQARAQNLSRVGHGLRGLIGSSITLSPTASPKSRENREQTPGLPAVVSATLCLCLVLGLAQIAFAQSNAPAPPTGSAAGSVTAAKETPNATAEKKSSPGDKAASSEAFAPKPLPKQDASRPSAPAAEPGQVFFEIKYSVDGAQIQGNSDRTFLHEGINHAAEMSFFSNFPVQGIRRLEVLSVGRYTNNPRLDPERNSLQRFYA